VTFTAFVTRYVNTAEHKRAAFDQFVHIVSDANAEHKRLSVVSSSWSVVPRFSIYHFPFLSFHLKMSPR
jgi:hypothetical protein